MHSIRTFLADLRATVRAHPLRAFAALALISSVVFLDSKLAADLGSLYFPNSRNSDLVAEIGLFRTNAIIGFSIAGIGVLLLVFVAILYNYNSNKKFWALILLVIAFILSVRIFLA